MRAGPARLPRGGGRSDEMDNAPEYVPDLFFVRARPQAADVVEEVVAGIHRHLGKKTHHTEVEARLGHYDRDGRFHADIGVGAFRRLNAALNHRCENLLMPVVRHTRHEPTTDTFYAGPKRLRYSTSTETGRAIELVDKQAAWYVDLPGPPDHSSPGARVCFSEEVRLDASSFVPPGHASITATRCKERVSYTLGYWTVDLTVVRLDTTVTYEVEVELTQPGVAEMACHDKERGPERLRTIAISLLNNLQSFGDIITGRR